MKSDGNVDRMVFRIPHFIHPTQQSDTFEYLYIHVIQNNLISYTQLEQYRRMDRSAASKDKRSKSASQLAQDPPMNIPGTSLAVSFFGYHCFLLHTL
jgi:hypothetical protein